MAKVEDLRGMKFGRLTVLERDYSKKVSKGYATFWICKCDCNNIVSVRGGDLKSGHTKSCSCFRFQRFKDMATTHKCSKTRLYNTWIKMKARCDSENDKSYKHYGGRGITVCGEWRNSFENFRDWALCHGYTDDLTIERIDVNGNYCPENCTWITKAEQHKNTRKTKNFEYNGKRMNVADWANEMNIPKTTLYGRLRLGWTFEEAITIPVKVGNNQNLRAATKAQVSSSLS